VRSLTRQVRLAQRGSWFPLLVFAGITLGAIPIYRFAPRHLGPCRASSNGTSVCTAVIPALLVYWPVALVLAYVAIANFYLSQSRRRGVGTTIRPYVLAGLVITVLVTAASLWRLSHPLVPVVGNSGSPLGRAFYDVVGPPAAIGLGLLVLARVERSRALLAFGVGYLVVVLVQGGRMIHSRTLWWFLPQLLVPATLLLLGSGLFALMRPKTTAPSR
jgi:hypothetical protein